MKKEDLLIISNIFTVIVFIITLLIYELKTKELSEQIHYYANAHGRSQNPMDVFLISLGIPTLKIRMIEHEKNSIIIAKF